MKPNFLVAATKELSDELLAVEKVADEERLRDGKWKYFLRKYLYSVK